MEAWSAFRDWGLTFSDPDVARQAKFPKLYVVGSIPIARSINLNNLAAFGLTETEV